MFLAHYFSGSFHGWRDAGHADGVFTFFFVSSVVWGHMNRNRDTLDSDISACFCAETAAGAVSAALVCRRL